MNPRHVEGFSTAGEVLAHCRSLGFRTADPTVQWQCTLPQGHRGNHEARHQGSALLMWSTLCRCESPVCPLPHDPWRHVAHPPDGVLCECLDPLCRLAHTQEAAARFVLNASGYALWSLRHSGLPGGIPKVRDSLAYQPPQTGKADPPRSAS